MAPSDSIIRSRSNPILKRVAAARAGKLRDLLVLEGERLIGDALGAGVALEVLLVADDRDLPAWVRTLDPEHVRRVESSLLQRASALVHSPGTLALAQAPSGRELAQLEIPPDGLVLVVSGVADPGNLGGLARSAEAAGVAAILVVGGGVSPWNDKALRGSMGSLLRVPVVLGDSADDVARTLSARGLRQVVAATRDGAPFDAFDWSGPVALWVSGETGLEPDVLRDFERVTIPMSGSVESLNVTVAGSLLLFAARRGR